MNDDLISRSAVIALIDKFGYINCKDGKDFESNSRVDKIRQKVLELPKDSYIDDVIKKLESMKYKDPDCEYDEGANDMCDVAIGLLKDGVDNE